MSADKQKDRDPRRAKVELSDVPLDDLRQELARSRILATAVEHLQQVGGEEAIFSLHFGLEF